MFANSGPQLRQQAQQRTDAHAISGAALYAARLREFVPRQYGVGALPELRQLLLKYPDARALAMARLRHAKYFTADFLSGGYRITTLVPSPDWTLMQLTCS